MDNQFGADLQIIRLLGRKTQVLEHISCRVFNLGWHLGSLCLASACHGVTPVTVGVQARYLPSAYVASSFGRHAERIFPLRTWPRRTPDRRHASERVTRTHQTPRWISAYSQQGPGHAGCDATGVRRSAVPLPERARVTCRLPNLHLDIRVFSSYPRLTHAIKAIVTSWATMTAISNPRCTPVLAPVC